MDAGDEHAADGALPDRLFALHEWHVGDHDAGLLQEAQLELEGRLLAERLEQGRFAEHFGDDDVDEVGLVTGDAPDELEERLDSAVVSGDELEERPVADPSAPVGADRCISAAARHVHGPEVRSRDLACVPDGSLDGLVGGVHCDNRQRPWRCRGGDRGCACAEASGGAAVVAVDPEEREDEERDRDDHEPGALRELGQDDDHENDAGGGGANGVDGGAALPARPAGPSPVAHHARLGEREGGENADHVEMDQ